MTSKVIYKGELRTEAVHQRSNVSIITDAPIDNQGKGESFSPTDLVATALASCMATIMGIKARDLGIDIENTNFEVLKVMGTEPRRITELEINIYSPHKYDNKTQTILERAALTCPVAASIHPDIEQKVKFIYPE
jgi:uncharacterized OsmC-like protein